MLQRSDLAQPLLPLADSARQSSALSFFETDRTRASSSSWYSSSNNTASRQLIGGCCLFFAGFLVDDIGTGIFVNKHIVSDRFGLFWVFFAFFQVTGLLFMTRADIDMNQYLRYNKVFLVTFILLYFVNVGVSIVWSTTTWVQALPFVYMTVRFDQCSALKPGFPTFSELFVASLTLNIPSTWVVYFFREDYPSAAWFSIAGTLGLIYVAYINAHGTSTAYNDKFETMAIKDWGRRRSHAGTPAKTLASMPGLSDHPSGVPPQFAHAP